MSLVEVINVTKQYANGEEKITPLSEVSLEIERGDFASLMGASGSGKSTLLNLIAGIDEVTLGYIFQTHNLIPVLTAYENVEMPLLLLKMSAAERRKRVEIAMEAVSLTDRASHYPRQMSGGQEQRVGIARAIVASPTLVVADEPTGNLDDETTEQILELLRRVNDELGITLLMVTHDVEASHVAKRWIRLERGKLVERAESAESRTESQKVA